MRRTLLEAAKGGANGPCTPRADLPLHDWRAIRCATGPTIRTSGSTSETRLSRQTLAYSPGNAVDTVAVGIYKPPGSVGDVEETINFARRVSAQKKSVTHIHTAQGMLSLPRQAHPRSHTCMSHHTCVDIRHPDAINIENMYITDALCSLRLSLSNRRDEAHKQRNQGSRRWYSHVAHEWTDDEGEERTDDDSVAFVAQCAEVRANGVRRPQGIVEVVPNGE